jgi:hypothetical protein
MLGQLLHCIFLSSTTVQPSSYAGRFLTSITANGLELRTSGSDTFPDNQVFTIGVTARDTTNHMTSTSVAVLVGIRPPQIYQSTYQGTVMENTLPQQT